MIGLVDLTVMIPAILILLFALFWSLMFYIVGSKKTSDEGEETVDDEFEEFIDSLGTKKIHSYYTDYSLDSAQLLRIDNKGYSLYGSVYAPNNWEQIVYHFKRKEK